MWFTIIVQIATSSIQMYNISHLNVKEDFFLNILYNKATWIMFVCIRLRVKMIDFQEKCINKILCGRHFEKKAAILFFLAANVFFKEHILRYTHGKFGACSQVCKILRINGPKSPSYLCSVLYWIIFFYFKYNIFYIFSFIKVYYQKQNRFLNTTEDNCWTFENIRET